MAVQRVVEILRIGVPVVTGFVLKQVLQEYCESQMRCYHAEGAVDTLRIETEQKSKYDLCSIYIPNCLKHIKKRYKTHTTAIGIPTDQTSENGKNPVFKEIMQHALDSDVNVLKSVDKK